MASEPAVDLALRSRVDPAGPAGVAGVAGVAGLAGLAGVAGVAGLAERVRPVELRSEQPTLPMLSPLEGLLPGGLARGSVVAVGAATGVSGATTLALAVAAGPSRAGAWVALVGVAAPAPRRARSDRTGGEWGAGALGFWGLLAAAGLGVALERLVVVAPPERPAGGWGAVVATLVDGFPVVVLGAQVQLRACDDRRLAARLRERGGVLVRAGSGAGVPTAAHLRLLVTESRWEGVAEGSGHLRARRVVVEATGRGAASRLRRAELLLPGPGGEVALVPPTPEEIGPGPRHLFPRAWAGSA